MTVKIQIVENQLAKSTSIEVLVTKKGIKYWCSFKNFKTLCVSLSCQLRLSCRAYHDESCILMYSKLENRWQFLFQFNRTFKKHHAFWTIFHNEKWSVSLDKKGNYLHWEAWQKPSFATLKKPFRGTQKLTVNPIFVHKRFLIPTFFANKRSSVSRKKVLCCTIVQFG